MEEQPTTVQETLDIFEEMTENFGAKERCHLISLNLLILIQYKFFLKHFNVFIYYIDTLCKENSFYNAVPLKVKVVPIEMVFIFVFMSIVYA